MKKLMIGIALMTIGCLATWGQTTRGPISVQIQTGYNGSSGWLDGGNVSSAGVGFSLTDHFKLDLALAYYYGKVRGDEQLTNHIWTFMVAPEFGVPVGMRDEFYGLVGLGLATRSSWDSQVFYPRGLMHGSSGETKLAAEVGAGYRHFFNDAVGLSLQVTYTRIQFDQVLSPLDGRVGVVFRF